jgi:hypothetical protein
MKLLTVLFALFLGSVMPLVIMPSPQGTHWYAGETIYLRVVSNSDTDGTSYNLYLKEGSIKEAVYTGAQYNVPIRFVVPSAFGSNGCGKLYAVAEGSPATYDTMNVQIMTLYDYNLYYNGDGRYFDWDYSGSGRGGCSGCRI